MWNIFFYNAGENSSRRSYEELLMSIWLLSNSIKTLRVNWHPCQMIKQVSMQRRISFLHNAGEDTGRGILI